MLNIGWLSTGNGVGSYGLLKTIVDAIRGNNLSVHLSFVFCNRELGEHEGSDRFIRLVEDYGIPLVTFSSRKFRKYNDDKPWQHLRECYEREVLERLSILDAPDIIIGAGYMLIAPLLCEKFLMLNLHPALPGGPIGTWKNVLRYLIDHREKETGVMLHIATPEVDKGQIISFCRFPIPYKPVGESLSATEFTPTETTNNHASESLIREIRGLGLQMERLLLLKTLHAISSGEITIARNYNSQPLDMTERIESALESINTAHIGI